MESKNVVFTDRMGTEIKEGDTVIHFHTGSKGHGAIIFAKAIVLGLVERNGEPYKIKILKNDENTRNLSQVKPNNCIVTKSDKELERLLSTSEAYYSIPQLNQV